MCTAACELLRLSCSKISTMEIAKKIALIRKQKGLTQEQLADLANVTVRTIQRIESGENKPRAYTVKILADALKIDFEDLGNQLQEENSPGSINLPESRYDPENEREFLKNLCLSCFSYLLIPLIHFLIPLFILKRSNNTNAKTIAFGRKIIRQQIYWKVTVALSLMLILAYNLIMAANFKKAYTVNYLWPFLILYFLNSFIIINNMYRLKRIEL